MQRAPVSSFAACMLSQSGRCGPAVLGGGCQRGRAAVTAEGPRHVLPALWVVRSHAAMTDVERAPCALALCLCRVLDCSLSPVYAMV